MYSLVHTASTIQSVCAMRAKTSNGRSAVRILAALATLAVVSGCAVAPPVKNPQGQPVNFSGPILGPSERDNGIYVLLEKSIADGKFRVVSTSKKRQPIANERQERVVFNQAITQFAPDFSADGFETYSDDGNYGQRTVIVDCRRHGAAKVTDYSPCSSEFSYVSTPTEN
ncbi:hypothetical protein [Bordetella genomosp. 13]|uniref:hypothetical protein n=1 Tax=Bordetella genomosp. 13 TaxID=463040 RepID=UPI0011A8FFAA|nr:hypothetical protein [Bordetella genomosp. 13]